MALVAVTVKTYEVPFVRPVTTALGVSPSGVTAISYPGVEVTV